MQLLVRPTSRRDGPTVLGDSTDLVVEHPEITREVSRHNIPGFGPIAEVTGTGKYDHRHVDVRVRRTERNSFTTASGTAYSGYGGRIAVARAGEHIRMPQEDDLETIAKIDAEVERLRKLIGEQRKLRRAAVQRAWRRARKATARQVVEEAAKQEARQ